MGEGHGSDVRVATTHVDTPFTMSFIHHLPWTGLAFVSSQRYDTLNSNKALIISSLDIIYNVCKSCVFHSLYISCLVSTSAAHEQFQTGSYSLLFIISFNSRLLRKRDKMTTLHPP
jgi:hypothetical protein